MPPVITHVSRICAVVSATGINTQRRTCITSVLPSGQVHVPSAIVIGPPRPWVNQCVSKMVPDSQMMFALVSSLAVNVPFAGQGEFGVWRPAVPS